MSAEQQSKWAQRHPNLHGLMDTLGAIGRSAGDARAQFHGGREEGLQEDAERIASDEEMAKMEKILSQTRMESTNSELEETKAALKTVKDELNEVNLLNSKLLYVNRIFKASNLSESQKLRVVETLDKAECVKEAKLIYETIKDSFTIANKKKSFKRQTKSLKEGLGMASKPSGTTQSDVRKEVISESNDMVSRFQKLANIKINQ